MQPKPTDSPIGPATQLRLKIGVMGGATSTMTTDVFEKAHALGRAVAANECILITGGCPGLPLAADSQTLTRPKPPTASRG